MEELSLWKQRYLHSLELDKGLSRNSLRAIQGDLQKFLQRLLEEQQGSEALEVYHLKSYLFFLQGQGLSDKSIQRNLSSLKGFFRFLWEQGIQKEDFSLYFSKWNAEEEEFFYFSKTDWEIFRESFQTNVTDRAIFELLYSTGLKPKEFLSLSYMQIQWEKREIYLLEKRGGRTVFFSQRAKEALWNYCEQENIRDGFLWRFSENLLRNRLLYYKEKGKLPKEISLYSFRHSFAIHLLEAGMSKREVKYLLGLEQGEGLIRYEKYINKER